MESWLDIASQKLLDAMEKEGHTLYGQKEILEACLKKINDCFRCKVAEANELWMANR